MPSLNLDGLRWAQIVSVGDALVRAGEAKLAEDLYRTVLRAVPTASHILSRVGLTQCTNGRTIRTLDALEAIESVGKGGFASDGLLVWLKTIPFMEDARFLALADKHADLLPLPNWHWNLQTVVWAVNQARPLDGDFVELGVFKGHTTLFVAEYVGFADWPHHWRLYDTFEGIPADQLDPGWDKKNHNAYAGTFSYEEVRDRFAHIPNIEVIQGRVPEVLLDSCPERIAFLHMDLNNTHAEIQALDMVFDRIVPGGVIIFDDYVWAASRAQYDAEKAWFEARGLMILPLPTGQGVFIKSA